MSYKPNLDPRCPKNFYLCPLTVPNVMSGMLANLKKGILLKQDICKRTGLSSKKTNHSSWASTVTCLYEEDIDE